MINQGLHGTSKDWCFHIMRIRHPRSVAGGSLWCVLQSVAATSYWVTACVTAVVLVIPQISISKCSTRSRLVSVWTICSRPLSNVCIYSITCRCCRANHCWGRDGFVGALWPVVLNDLSAVNEDLKVKMCPKESSFFFLLFTQILSESTLIGYNKAYTTERSRFSIWLAACAVIFCPAVSCKLT